MKRTPLILGALLLTAALTSETTTMLAQSSADVPRTISYQGLLTSHDGTPLADGNYDVTVTIYADARGSRSVWSQTIPTSVRGGVFNIYLGENSPLPTSDRLNSPLWIGTSVNGGDEMTPLTPLTASPYALNVPNKAITGSKLADKAVTEDKVDMDYVAGLKINGEEFRGRGTMLSIQSGTDIDVRYDEATESVVIESKHTESMEGDGEKGATTQDDDGTLAGTAAGFTSTNWRGRDPVNWASPLTAPFPNVTGGSYSSVGGGSANTITDANYSGIFGGDNNQIFNNADYDFIGGGLNNIILNDAMYNSIVGGENNQIMESSNHNFIGGGRGHMINMPSNNSFIGGGETHMLTGMLSTIGGGGGHVIEADEATIAGGHFNEIYSYVATIAGGHDNRIFLGSEGAFIGGGYNNQVDQSSRGAIGGGEGNSINAGSERSFIGGGDVNMIEQSIQSSIVGGTGNTLQPGADQSFIGGGELNRIYGGTYNAIVGGSENLIEANTDYSIIGGGATNRLAEGDYNVIGGGQGNTAGIAGNVLFPEWGVIGGGNLNTLNDNADYGFIGGGRSNTTDAGWTVVGGGNVNQILAGSDYATISGGLDNVITSGNMATIGGGANHNISAPEATIAGGHVNTVESYAGAITGGHTNVVGLGADFGFIGGGNMNSISNGPISTIGGGEGNIISAPEAVIGGGHFNSVYSYAGSILGGHDNIVGTQSETGFIGAGRNNFNDARMAGIGSGEQNQILSTSDYSFIGAGQGNRVINGANYAAIGGGQENAATGFHTAIPGGDLLLTDPSYAQVVMGFYNAPRGAGVGVRPNGGTIAATDLPLVIVGNGDVPLSIRSNAFEVSYNGHSTVFDENGSGGATGAPPYRSAFRGATYVDNILYAWGDVPVWTTTGLIPLNDDFGVASVARTGPGRYTVTLNYQSPYGTGTTIDIAVTATINDNSADCAIIRIFDAGGSTNTFDVLIDDLSCNGIDKAFQFHVAGRPAP